MSVHSTGSISSRGGSLGDHNPLSKSQAELPLRAPPRIFEKSCPYCRKRAGCWISWSEDHFAMRFYRCNGQVNGKPCNYLEWIDLQHEGYVKVLLLSLRDACLESKNALQQERVLWNQAEVLRSDEQLLNRATILHMLEVQLENKTARIQELEEQLQNKARMQQHEKARGSWFSVFLWFILWFISVSSAMFVGAALIYAKSS